MQYWVCVEPPTVDERNPVWPAERMMREYAGVLIYCPRLPTSDAVH